MVRAMARTIVDYLGQRGIEGKAVASAQEALDSPDLQSYDAIISDYQMPGMDGEALGRIVASEQRFAGTKLVMLTSLGQRGDARRLAESGFSAALIKPVRQSELFDCLTSVLGEAGIPAQPQPSANGPASRDGCRRSI